MKFDKKLTNRFIMEFRLAQLIGDSRPLVRVREVNECCRQLYHKRCRRQKKIVTNKQNLETERKAVRNATFKTGLISTGRWLDPTTRSNNIQTRSVPNE